MSNEMRAVSAQPAGVKGIISGRIMNGLHRRLYRKIIKKYLLEEFDLTFGNTVLDLGCGGGIAVKLYYEMLGNSMICGIDSSSDMVSLASTVNKAGIKRGIVEIRQAGVSDIPYPDNYFNIITAFDTINFWNEYQQSLSEISRVLSNGGYFMVVNAYPKEGTSWWNFVKFKNSDEYIALMEKNGLQNVHADLQNNTIVVCGRKLNSK